MLTAIMAFLARYLKQIIFAVVFLSIGSYLGYKVGHWRGASSNPQTGSLHGDNSSKSPASPAKAGAVIPSPPTAVAHHHELSAPPETALPVPPTSAQMPTPAIGEPIPAQPYTPATPPVNSPVVKPSQPEQFKVVAGVELATFVNNELRDFHLYRNQAEVPATWDIDVYSLAPAPPKKRNVQWKSSIGIGLSAGSWDDVKLALTYSPVQLWRIRPSLLLDVGSFVGVGVQFRLWRPIHAGAFLAWNISESPSPRSTRLTISCNF